MIQTLSLLENSLLNDELSNDEHLATCIESLFNLWNTCLKFNPNNLA